MSKLVTNTIKTPVSIVLDGVLYAVEGMGDVVVPDKIAKVWVGIHAFLKVSEVGESAKAKEVILEVIKDETPVEVKEEVKEEPKEEPKEESKEEVKVIKSKKGKK